MNSPPACSITITPLRVSPPCAYHRRVITQATLGGAKFYTHDTLSGAIEWYDAVKGCTGVVNLAAGWLSHYSPTLQLNVRCFLWDELGGRLNLSSFGRMSWGCFQ